MYNESMMLSMWKFTCTNIKIGYLVLFYLIHFTRPTFLFYLFKFKTNLPHSHLIIEIGGHKGIQFFFLITVKHALVTTSIKLHSNLL